MDFDLAEDRNSKFPNVRDSFSSSLVPSKPPHHRIVG
jgi:hypothetical protein